MNNFSNFKRRVTGFLLSLAIAAAPMHGLAVDRPNLQWSGVGTFTGSSAVSLASNVKAFFLYQSMLKLMNQMSEVANNSGIWPNSSSCDRDIRLYKDLLEGHVPTHHSFDAIKNSIESYQWTPAGEMGLSALGIILGFTFLCEHNYPSIATTWVGLYYFLFVFVYNCTVASLTTVNIVNDLEPLALQAGRLLENGTLSETVTKLLTDTQELADQAKALEAYLFAATFALPAMALISIFAANCCCPATKN